MTSAVNGSRFPSYIKKMVCDCKVNRREELNQIFNAAVCINYPDVLCRFPAS